ncbi:YopX family protein [Rhodococcus sp. IEGM1300]
MRDYKFRGKSIETGEWVYGSLLSNGDNAYIVMSLYTLNDALLSIEHHQVHPETVGQYTSINDTTGVKIFEQDIVDCKIQNQKDFGEVKYSEMLGAYFLVGLNRSDTELWGASKKIIIGNIHDNPELVQEED